MPKAVKHQRGRASQPAYSASGGGAAAARRPAASPWILNRWQDLLLFIATPLLIVPVVAFARRFYSDQGIYLFVLAFGAAGHHLPGMMRAYGDRALFNRFRTRFIVAPVFLLAFCLTVAQWDLNSLSVLLLLWGFWHGLMQVYGSVRIYDAKAGSFGAGTARLDWLLCLAWFGLGMILSPGRMGDLLDEYYKAGGPFIPPAAIHVGQDLWTVFATVVTVLFLWNYIRQRFNGQPANPVKLLIMATSFGFWWYSQVHINNIFLGLAMFEIFHDVQYLSIVWIYNRKRVTSDPNVGVLTRLLFRPSKVMMAVYVALCFVYAGSFYIGDYVAIQTSTAALFGLGAASTFLHFYFDGFIWKVREKSTREGLGLQGGAADAATVPKWAVHGAKWLLFVTPAVMLCFTELYRPTSLVDRYQNITAAVPSAGKFHYRLGMALLDQGEIPAAYESLSAAVEFDPNSADAHLILADVMRAAGDEAAVGHYRRALEINPKLAEAHMGLGLAYHRAKQFSQSEQEFARALEIKPDFVEARFNLAKSFQSQGRIPEAIEQLEEATRINPEFPEATQLLQELSKSGTPAASSTL